jgi:hypothetical protein
MNQLGLAIGSMLAVLIAAVGEHLANWYSARARSGSIDHTLEQSTKLLEFVERWTKVSNDIRLSEVVKEPGQSILKLASEAVYEDLIASRAHIGKMSHATSALGRLLLLHELVGWKSRIMRYVFYVLTLFSIFVLVLASINPDPNRILADVVVVSIALVLALSARGMVSVVR